MNQISSEIEREFPFVEKPQGRSLSFHKSDCDHCIYLRRDLEVYKGKELPREAIRCVHQEMSSLSAKGFAWVLPSYLRYAIASKPSYSNTEVEFLIYNLGPELKHQPEAMQRLSGLSSGQISCLISFLAWLKSQEHWVNYCSEDIERAENFLRTLKA